MIKKSQPKTNKKPKETIFLKIGKIWSHYGGKAQVRLYHPYPVKIMNRDLSSVHQTKQIQLRIN